jgi:hypothetical protein
MTKDEYLKWQSNYNDPELWALQNEVHAIPRPVSPTANEKRRVDTVYEHVRRIDELLDRTEDENELRRLLSVRARMKARTSTFVQQDTRSFREGGGYE